MFGGRLYGSFRKLGYLILGPYNEEPTIQGDSQPPGARLWPSQRVDEGCYKKPRMASRAAIQSEWRKLEVDK